MRNGHGMRSVSFVMGVALVVAAPALAGPDWEEIADGGGDAGALPGTAQVPNLSGPLNSIRGSLTGNAFGPGGSDFQDMYKIFIPTPSAFFAESLVVAGGFDIQLWLFDESGLGVLGNDNAMSITDQAAFGPATDDATPGLVAPGIYYLAISGAGSDPFSAGGEIFDFATPTEVSGPDGLGGSLPIAFWTEPGAIGEYYIELTGVEFVPAPATLLVLGFGGLLTARGRRRSA